MTLLLAAAWAAHLISWGTALRRAGTAAADDGEWPREVALRIAMVAVITTALATPRGNVVVLPTAVAAAAMLAFLGGHAVAIVARSTLDRAWGIGVRPREHGAPRRRGVYAVLRHPIYTGTFIAASAQLLLLQNAGAALLVVGAAIVIPVKAVLERRAWRGPAGA